MRRPFVVTEMFHLLFWLVVTWVYTIVKIDQTEYVCSIHFNTCKLFLNLKICEKVSMPCGKLPAKSSQNPLRRSQFLNHHTVQRFQRMHMKQLELFQRNETSHLDLHLLIQIEFPGLTLIKLYSPMSLSFVSEPLVCVSSLA